MERREVLQIKPTNQSDGVYSFNNGAPQIEFDIPRVPKFLLGKTLRIRCGLMGVLVFSRVLISVVLLT